MNFKKGDKVRAQRIFRNEILEGTYVRLSTAGSDWHVIMAMIRLSSGEVAPRERLVKNVQLIKNKELLIIV